MIDNTTKITLTIASFRKLLNEVPDSSVAECRIDDVLTACMLTTPLWIDDEEDLLPKFFDGLIETVKPYWPTRATDYRERCDLMLKTIKYIRGLV